MSADPAVERIAGGNTRARESEGLVVGVQNIQRAGCVRSAAVVGYGNSCFVGRIDKECVFVVIHEACIDGGGSGYLLELFFGQHLAVSRSGSEPAQETRTVLYRRRGNSLGGIVGFHNAAQVSVVRTPLFPRAAIGGAVESEVGIGRAV